MSLKINFIKFVFLSSVIIIVLTIFLPVLSTAFKIPNLALISYLAFAPFCHQLSDRSFHLLGIQLAVCARCTGIYGGLLLGAFVQEVITKLCRNFENLSSLVYSPTENSLSHLGLRVFFILVFLLDGLLNALSIISSPTWFRFLVGMGFGINGGWLLSKGVEDIVLMSQTKTKMSL